MLIWQNDDGTLEAWEVNPVVGEWLVDIENTLLKAWNKNLQASRENAHYWVEAEKYDA